jgi:hypothetical protein
MGKIKHYNFYYVFNSIENLEEFREFVKKLCIKKKFVKNFENHKIMGSYRSGSYYLYKIEPFKILKYFNFHPVWEVDENLIPYNI